MNLKNKLLSAGLAACMVVPMAMPVCAEDANPVAGNTRSTTLNYTVNESYEWSIHTAIDFKKDKDTNKTEVEGKVTDDTEQKVKVTHNVIGEGKKLHITARGNGTGDTFSIKTGKSTVLNYAVKSGNGNVVVNGTVLDVNAGTDIGSTDMTFILSTETKSAEIAGTYTGDIIYTASVVPQVGA